MSAKHVLHGDEQQGGAAQIAGGIQSEAAGQHAQAGHQSHQRVHDHDQQRVLLDVLLLIQIGAVGNHGRHAQGQGEEHLAAGGSTVRTSGVSCLKVTMRCMTPLISTADIFTPSMTAEAGT